VHPPLFATLLVVAVIAFIGGCAPPPSAPEEDPPGDPCESQKDCASGRTCIEDVCVYVCGDGWSCADPEVCVGRRCVAPGPCDDGIDCDGIDACLDGRCVAVPELARCAKGLAWDPVVHLAGPDAPVRHLGFRNADGDAARELVGAQQGIVSQVRSGDSTAQVLYSAEPGDSIVDLEIVDLDLDGLDDVAVASKVLTFLDVNGATPEASQYYQFTDIEAVDEQPGVGSPAGVGLGMCRLPNPEPGCPPELIAAWGEPGLSQGASAADRALHLASGDFLGSGGRYLVVGTRDGFHLFLPGRKASLDHDVGVDGSVFAVGDLDADGVDEVVRLTPREAWTLATVWQAANGEFKPGQRVRLAGEYGRAVRIGNVDGDGIADVVLGGPDGLAIWHAPRVSGCFTVEPTAHAVVQVAVGDHDGDGRDEVALADDERLTIVSARPL
jgi:hypothetical protein